LGYQMLGEKILDPLNVEGTLPEIRGLGLIPSITTFGPEKVTKQVKAVHLESGIELEAYEIHMGITTVAELAKPVFKIIERNGVPVNVMDGIVLSKSQVWGTYLHGIFDSNEFRTYVLNPFRKKKGILVASTPLPSRSREGEYERLAHLVRSHINRDLFDRILNRKELIQNNT
jgi:adenosylcobyric acid synthase